MKRLTIVTFCLVIIALLAPLATTPRFWCSVDVSLGTVASPTQTAAQGHELSSPQSTPDFSLNAAPNTLTLKPGDTGQSSVQLASLNGFSGDVTFTVSVWPPGPSAELNPGSTILASGETASSVLTGSTTPSTPEGLYNVSIDAASGSTRHSVYVTINVTPKNMPNNHPPSLTVPGPESVTAGSPLVFTVSATDPDMRETATMSVVALPSGASFEPATGQFSWTPSSSQTGDYNVTFTATDNSSPPLSDTKTVLISVEAPTSPAPSQPSQQPCLWCELANFLRTNLWLVGVGIIGGFLAGYVGSRRRSKPRPPRDRVVEQSLKISESKESEEEAVSDESM